MNALALLDRIGRPLQRIAALALLCAVTWFALRFGDVTMTGLERWARGEAVDLGGFAGVLTAFAGILGVVIVHVVALFRDRRLERVEEIRAGRSPAPIPFGAGSSSSPSPAAEADRDDPSLSPRPAENWA